jgi:NADPH:quinone reductase-like Zn-dependent oxidoreductase
MKAVVQLGYGSTEQLELREIEAPAIEQRDVLVRVNAASLHPDVWHMLRGEPRILRLMGAGLLKPKRAVPGTDLAGVVEAAGPGVTHFQVGDEVFGKTVGANSWRNGGAYAELAAVREDFLERKPANRSFEQAAASPDSGTIAIQGLRDEGRLRAGQRVLINGAGGGVGTFAVQIAKALGATHVTAVDVARKLPLLGTIGADETVDAAEDFTSGGERFDVILDIPGNRPFSAIRRILEPEGTYVLIGHDAFGREGRRWAGSMGRFVKLLIRSPFEKQLPGLRGARDPGDRLQLLTRFLEDGGVVPVIDRTFPLAEVASAIDYLQTGAATGKIVITIGP